MRSRKLRIDGTSYRAMHVWDGERHQVRIRFLDKSRIACDRGAVHTIAQRAANFTAARRLTTERASRGKWHTVRVGRRALARRLMVEIEPLVARGTVEVELDGCIVRMAKD